MYPGGCGVVERTGGPDTVGDVEVCARDEDTGGKDGGKEDPDEADQQDEGDGGQDSRTGLLGGSRVVGEATTTGGTENCTCLGCVKLSARAADGRSDGAFAANADDARGGEEDLVVVSVVVLGLAKWSGSGGGRRCGLASAAAARPSTSTSTPAGRRAATPLQSHRPPTAALAAAAAEALMPSIGVTGTMW